jgi:hypothetical protein
VYVGHAAIALVLKSRAPSVPIVPLALACYGPDWIDVALMLPSPRAGMAPYSHSLPAIVAGAMVASGLYALFARRPGALMLMAGWLLHWPADVLTGRKPLIGLQPLVGLDLYHAAPLDFALEGVVVIVACVLYARVRAHDRQQRRIIVALAVALIVLQLAFNVTVSHLDGLPWQPSLA